jgi:uracil phosphoribosyltransferase
VARLAPEILAGFEVKVCPSGEVALGEVVAFDPMLATGNSAVDRLKQSKPNRARSALFACSPAPKV